MMVQAVPVSNGYRAYVVGLLLLAYVFNFMDRQVLAILAEPIKQDMKLADWQIGVMSGPAFALFYTFLGIPIARMAETANRSYIISASVAVWSIFTALCGSAHSFIQFVLFRIGVGVGEAGCTPPALSLLSDYVPKKNRSFAFSIYMAGVPLGGLLGMAVGGLVADSLGWRNAFLVVSIPGVVIAALIALTLREPRAQELKKAGGITTERDSFLKVAQILWAKKTYRYIVCAVTMEALFVYGLTAFWGSFFFRNHAEQLEALASTFGLGTAGFLGVALGLALGISGVVGSLSGGLLTDRFSKNDPRAQMSIPAIGALLSTPFYFVVLFTDSAVIALAMLFLPSILNAFWFGPAYAAVQGLVQPSSRATATAVMLFILNLIGLGLGPLIVGFLSDAISGNLGLGPAEGIRWALATFTLLCIPAGALFWISRRTIIAETVT